MKWWNDRYNEFDNWLDEGKSFFVFQFGVWLMLGIFIITNAISYISNQHLADRVFWYLFDVGLICFSLPFRNKTWVTNSFFILALYNLVDEILGRGATLQTFEYPLALSVMLFSYLKFKKGWIF